MRRPSKPKSATCGSFAQAVRIRTFEAEINNSDGRNHRCIESIKLGAACIAPAEGTKPASRPLLFAYPCHAPLAALATELFITSGTARSAERSFSLSTIPPPSKPRDFEMARPSRDLNFSACPHAIRRNAAIPGSAFQLTIPAGSPDHSAVSVTGALPEPWRGDWPLAQSLGGL